MRLSRQKTLPPHCPFCDRQIDRPGEMVDGEWHEFEGGRCECGAVYALDPTARNGGAVMLEAMVYACDGDWDQALQLGLGTDYQESRIRKYDGRTHQVGAENAFGTLYFIRLVPVS